MRVAIQKNNPCPKVSLILLDWSVRESFHICHYLSKQTVPRSQFEIIVIEYYSKESSAVHQFKNDIDLYVLLEMPDFCYYHKHLMYNVGFLFSKGEIIIICDSDSMVTPHFIESIIQTFEEKDNIFLHLDQFRNINKKFYPFNYPSFKEVVGEGCINLKNGKTKGIEDSTDVLHTRNYGTCFCCRRENFISIGGADEHIDYVGHICGPYDLSFRLINAGLEEIWHKTEFLYHTWHPGTDGHQQYCGPHDGKNMSTTALSNLFLCATQPHFANPLINEINSAASISLEKIKELAISEEIFKITSFNFLNHKEKVSQWAQNHYSIFNKNGYIIKKNEKGYFIYNFLAENSKPLFKAKNKEDLKKILHNQKTNHKLRKVNNFFKILFFTVIKKIIVLYKKRTRKISTKLEKIKKTSHYNQSLIINRPDLTFIIKKIYKKRIPAIFVLNEKRIYLSLIEINRIKKDLTLLTPPSIEIVYTKTLTKEIKKSINLFEGLVFAMPPIYQELKNTSKHQNIIIFSDLKGEKNEEAFYGSPIC